MRNLVLIFLVSTLAILLFSCGEDKDHVSNETNGLEFYDQVSGTIAETGGTVDYPDGAAVQIPANTFSSETIVTVSKIKDDSILPIAEESKPITAVYELRSEPKMDYFGGVVEISLPVDSENTPNDNNLAYIAYWNGENWVGIASYFDKETDKLVGYTNHFSQYRGYSQQQDSADEVFLYIPYYNQGGYPWCAYTTATMILKAYGVDKEVYNVVNDINDQDFACGLTVSEGGVRLIGNYISGQISCEMNYRKWYRGEAISDEIKIKRAFKEYVKLRLS